MATDDEDVLGLAQTCDQVRYAAPRQYDENLAFHLFEGMRKTLPKSMAARLRGISGKDARPMVLPLQAAAGRADQKGRPGPGLLP